MTNDRALVREVSRMDNVVDKLDEAIKLYVTKLTRGSLDEREGHRAMEIISFTINLEHIGDIIDKNLSELAAKKIKRRLQFSSEGAEELAAFHKRILESLRMALGVFMSGDLRDARKLIAEKAELRNAELAAAERHLGSVAPGPAGDPGDDVAASRRACATSSASTRTSARWPIRCWRPPVSRWPPRRWRATPSPWPLSSPKPTTPVGQAAAQLKLMQAMSLEHGWRDILNLSSDPMSCAV